MYIIYICISYIYIYIIYIYHIYIYKMIYWDVVMLYWMKHPNIYTIYPLYMFHPELGD